MIVLPLWSQESSAPIWFLIHNAFGLHLSLARINGWPKWPLVGLLLALMAPWLFNVSVIHQWFRELSIFLRGTAAPRFAPTASQIRSLRSNSNPTELSTVGRCFEKADTIENTSHGTINSWQNHWWLTKSFFPDFFFTILLSNNVFHLSETNC